MGLFVKMDALQLGRDGLRHCSSALCDLDTLLLAFPQVTVVWHAAGFCRIMTPASCSDHMAVLQSLMHHRNLLVTIPPEMIDTYQPKLSELVDFVSKNWEHVAVASNQVHDVTTYSAGIQTLQASIRQLPQRFRAAVARRNASRRCTQN